jgi:hypothetical protein
MVVEIEAALFQRRHAGFYFISIEMIDADFLRGNGSLTPVHRLDIGRVGPGRPLIDVHDLAVDLHRRHGPNEGAHLLAHADRHERMPNDGDLDIPTHALNFQLYCLCGDAGQPDRRVKASVRPW